MRQGRVAVPGGRVFYRVVGGQRKGTPLLLLHGGPGGGMVSMLGLRPLAAERPVIFYDQLGCGRSPASGTAQGLWRVERFVAEIDALRRHLDLREIHLLGHSWGGMLAQEYLLTRPSGVRSVTLCNTFASTRTFVSEVWRLVDAMPLWPRRALQRGSGDLSYALALLWFRLRHMVRLRNLPDPRPILGSMWLMLHSPAYADMWGADELRVTGSLSNWDCTDRLAAIEVPALVLTGQYDEATPHCARELARGLPRARLHVFEGCSHLTLSERPRDFNAVVRHFLHACETSPGGHPPPSGR